MLDLSYNSIGREGMVILCKHLSAATPLRSLSVVGNRVPDGAAVPLASLILPCSACELEILDLSQNVTLGTTAVLKLAQALEYNTDLQDLRLANCHLGVEQDLCLAACSRRPSLQNWENIKARDLAKVACFKFTVVVEHAGDTAVEAIVKSLCSHTSLMKLDISGCKLGQEGASKLSDALHANSAITHLSLAKNSLGDRGAASIATILQRNPIIRLDTSCNHIQTTGADILARSLQMCMVRSCLLSAHGISCVTSPASGRNYNSVIHDCVYLHSEQEQSGRSSLIRVSGWHDLQELRHLDLSGNDVGDHGIVAIVQSAQNLLSIVLSKTGMTAKGLIHVSNWMSSNATKIRLQHLDISKNCLGDKGTRNFCTAVNSCTQLKTVKLTGCRLGCSSGRSVLSMLERLSDYEVANERRHSLQVSGD